jgi:hypothetical protein
MANVYLMVIFRLQHYKTSSCFVKNINYEQYGTNFTKFLISWHRDSYSFPSVILWVVQAALPNKEMGPFSIEK